MPQWISTYPLSKAIFLNQRSAVNDVNFQQTLQREAFSVLTRLESSKIAPDPAGKLTTPIDPLVLTPRRLRHLDPRRLELDAFGVSGSTLAMCPPPKNTFWPHCLLDSGAGAEFSYTAQLKQQKRDITLYHDDYMANKYHIYFRCFSCMMWSPSSLRTVLTMKFFYIDRWTTISRPSLNFSGSGQITPR